MKVSGLHDELLLAKLDGLKPSSIVDLIPWLDTTRSTDRRLAIIRMDEENGLVVLSAPDLPLLSVWSTGGVLGKMNGETMGSKDFFKRLDSVVPAHRSLEPRALLLPVYNAFARSKFRNDETGLARYIAGEFMLPGSRLRDRMFAKTITPKPNAFDPFEL
jgi:hypothetical protein